MAVRCLRCNRTYRSWQAFYQHARDSRHHNECPECDFDGECWSDLLDHCRDEGCRAVCGGCNSHFDYQEYWEHLEDENVCRTCERHFDSPSNLYQHQLTHRAANFECLCCYQKFKTYGGMIIHLEYGSCSSIGLTDLNKLAAKCNSWSHFIDSYYRRDMLDGIDPECYRNKAYLYKCPTCETQLPKLSSLFQHVESSACSQQLNEGAIGRLRRFLLKRLG
ncbi:hypothetical protein K458DRAFT_81828 [Lentithecium fluviatile CBS 122367]|uniref:C2H2-type domain-containing protein n=1 Tax=Lentithecium fluviatile CBS 122367 TaxID=1168545 RepID=A0A6G1IUA2_9PLEO|nr:hypothetical protein K458DRAFT_81828 [Lentithecium fluviatile CBS 122367]